MTIKQQGGIFGRNPTFNNVEIDGDLTVEGATTKNGNEVINGNLDISGTNPFLYLLETDVTDDSTFIRQASGNFQIGQTSDDKGTRKTRLLIDQSAGDIKFYNAAGTSALLTYDAGTGNLEMASGSGIDFSATSGTGTSELFDDYEEGTWTPVPADAASGGNTGTAATAIGHYTKVGRVVTVAVDLVNIDKTALTAGNSFFVQGLPFAAASLTGSMQFTGVSSGGSTFGGTVVCPVVYDANSAIRFFDPTGIITDTYLVSDVAANADIRFSLTYFA